MTKTTIRVKNAATVDDKLLDAVWSRYDLVKLAVMHVGAMKRTQEYSGWHAPQIIKQSLDDILSGTVKADDVMAAHKKIMSEPEKPAEALGAAPKAAKAADPDAGGKAKKTPGAKKSPRKKTD